MNFCHYKGPCESCATPEPMHRRCEVGTQSIPVGHGAGSVPQQRGGIPKALTAFAGQALPKGLQSPIATQCRSSHSPIQQSSNPAIQQSSNPQAVKRSINTRSSSSATVREIASPKARNDVSSKQAVRQHARCDHSMLPMECCGRVQLRHSLIRLSVEYLKRFAAILRICCHTAKDCFARSSQ